MSRLIFAGKVWLLAVAIRVALRTLPYAHAQRLIARWSRPHPRRGPRETRPERIAYAVRRAAALVPGASCLTQALATQVLLGRAGYDPHLRLGLRQGNGSVLQAHAWIENQGEVVIGLVDADDFVPLPTLEKR